MPYKLVCFDMDGVFFNQFSFWMELHKIFGTSEEGRKLTDKYLLSDYDKLVEEVVGRLWKGKDAKPYYDLVNSIPYLPGVKEAFEYLKKKGFITAIISGSSTDVARRVQKDFDVDYIFANDLIIKDGKVSGEYTSPVKVGRHNKAIIIRGLCSELGISTSETIFIGDSEYDIEAFKEVGFSIAFNSKCEELKKVASVVVDSQNLADVLEYLP